VGPLQAELSPNGDGLDDQLYINYSLSRPAKVSIILEDGLGNRYVLRDGERRAPGSYSFLFRGTYAPDPTRMTRRILPNGAYTYTVIAEEDTDGQAGQRAEARGTVIIRDAQTEAPEFRDVALTLNTISPNGDALEDETVISYGLTKPALVSIEVTDAKGTTWPVLPEEEKTAALHSFRWDGTSAKQLLPDGPYTVRLIARDRAGNVTEHREAVVLQGGGTPRLEIVEVRFTPRAVPKGGILKVEMRVRNSGDTVIHTLGPPPGTHYTTDMNFNAFLGEDGQPLYFERPGVWRVCVDWDQSGRLYPARWGLGKDLLPGEEVTVTGTIQVNIDRVSQVRFWAGVEQGGVGFPGGQVGLTPITVSY
jgi:hypothetical protein